MAKKRSRITAKKRSGGATPSPYHKAFAATPYLAEGAQQLPDPFGMIPPRLSYWGNDNGVADCVCAEEAAAKAQFSMINRGTVELFIPPDQVVLWSTQKGFRDGASPTSVMEAMAQGGMTAADGKVYGDGPYHSVDWTNDATLSSNIYEGPVKLRVASGQLNGRVPNPAQNGWIVTGLQDDGIYDHCVNLCGFGSLQGLCGLLGAALPAGIEPTTRCYLMFTWGSIGIIDRASMINITGEAWLRKPTTVLQSAAGFAPASPAAGPALAAAAPGNRERLAP